MCMYWVFVLCIENIVTCWCDCTGLNKLFTLIGIYKQLNQHKCRRLPRANATHELLRGLRIVLLYRRHRRTHWCFG